MDGLTIDAIVAHSVAITAEVETDFTSVVRVLLHAIKPSSTTHGAIEVACDAAPSVRNSA